MSRLTAAQRRALPSSTFAGPNRSYPIPDKKHARAALMLINKKKGLTGSQKDTIRARARRMLASK